MKLRMKGEGTTLIINVKGKEAMETVAAIEAEMLKLGLKTVEKKESE